MKARVLTALAAMVLATGMPPIILDSLENLDGGGGQTPIVDTQVWVQHLNVLTS